MNGNENKRSSEELADEALDKVSGGMTASELMEYINFVKQFKRNNNCDSCQLYWDCTTLEMDHEDVYAMFDGNPNAKCPNFKS